MLIHQNIKKTKCWIWITTPHGSRQFNQSEIGCSYSPCVVGADGRCWHQRQIHSNPRPDWPSTLSRLLPHFTTPHWNSCIRYWGQKLTYRVNIYCVTVHRRTGRLKYNGWRFEVPPVWSVLQCCCCFFVTVLLFTLFNNWDVINKKTVFENQMGWKYSSELNLLWTRF